MPYYLYKLKFTTPVRFGIDKASSNLTTTAFTANADTLFSALCNEWVRIYGEKDLEEFVSLTREGSFLVSDLFPYRNIVDGEGNTEDCEIYMPKPAIMVERDLDSVKSRVDSVSKKKLKKMTHIDIGRIDEYLRFLKSGGDMSFGMDSDMIFSEEQNVRVSRTYEEESLPYQVAAVRFKKDAGLCFIVMVEEGTKEKLDIVIDSLSTTGIGGKRTSGFGKFQLDEDELEISEEFYVYESDRRLAQMLGKEGRIYVSLSCVVPGKDEMESISKGDNYYQLILRKGFIYSGTYSKTNVKRKQLAMLKAGACLREPVEGSIADVATDGEHSVYRYGKAMFLGVTI